MATYNYKCGNEKCEDHEKVKSVSMPMMEYSEDKLPKCEKCGEKPIRIFGIAGHQTFGDGYKG